MTQPRFVPCLTIGCDEYAVEHSRCAAHYVPYRGSTRKERLPKDWQARRQQVLIRDKSICHVCGVGGADAVDHIVAGDDHSFANLGAIHQNVPPYCHRAKTAMEGAYGQWGKPF